MIKKIIYGCGALIVLIACILPFTRADGLVEFEVMSKEVELIVTKHAQDFKKEDKKFIRKVYELNDSDYTDIICYGATSAMEVNEICVARYQNDEQKQRLLAQLQQRIESQYKSFSGYAPRQAELLKKATIVEKRDYIILVVHKDSTSIKEQLNALF